MRVAIISYLGENVEIKKRQGWEVTTRKHRQIWPGGRGRTQAQGFPALNFIPIKENGKIEIGVIETCHVMPNEKGPLIISIALYQD